MSLSTHRLFRSRDATTAVERGLLLALVVVAAIAGLGAVAAQVMTLFPTVPGPVPLG